MTDLTQHPVIDGRCPYCNRKMPKPYKPRPICECGNNRYSEWFNASSGTKELECTKCGKRTPE